MHIGQNHKPEAFTFKLSRWDIDRLRLDFGFGEQEQLLCLLSQVAGPFSHNFTA